MKTRRWWLPVALVLSGFVSGCSSDEAGCQEPCEDSEDCRAGYLCAGIGQLTERQCVPTHCETCVGQQCQITSPVNGDCSFVACLP